MNSVQEPDTSGKVILKTNYGELEVELWCNETPKACRNFIQLCLESYFDNTSFHRLIPGFMIQGGDPTNTGEGGESIYGEPFDTETHTRLRFTHRGIVAMANSKPHDNKSQFFITFDSCSWLDKKHTIFGKVAGDTLFNLLSMQHIDTDADDRPLTPITLLSTYVVINPIEDIIPRQLKSAAISQEPSDKISDPKDTSLPKTKKATALLSFQGDDFDDPESDADISDPNSLQKPKPKFISSHDALSDSKLSKEAAVDLSKLQKDYEKSKKSKEKKEKLKNQLKLREKSDQNPSNSLQNSKKLDNSLPIFNENSNEKSKKKPSDSILKVMKVGRDKKTGRLQIVWDDTKGKKGRKGKNLDGNDSSGSGSGSESENNDSSDDELDSVSKAARQKQKEEYEKLRLEALKFKSAENFGNSGLKGNYGLGESKKLLTSLEQRRLRFLENRKNRMKEDEIVSKLQKFRKTLNSSFNSEEDSWMNNSLRFHIDSARAYNNNSTNSAQNSQKLSEIPENPSKNAENQGSSTLGIGNNFTVSSLISMTNSNQNPNEKPNLYEMFNN